MHHTDVTASVHLRRRTTAAGFSTGLLIGALGGLIGLGGAEFRLPLLIGLFGFAALEAVILNKATSLIVVALLSGSVIGAWAWLVGTWQLIAGVGSGFGIGVIASFLGVAGGELLIPTLVLLFGVEIKLAGSLSLAVSLPTMIVGFVRYSRVRSFEVIARHSRFLLSMGVGSLAGTFVGGLLLGVVPSAILLPALAAILFVSAIKIWRHQ